MLPFRGDVPAFESRECYIALVSAPCIVMIQDSKVRLAILRNLRKTPYIHKPYSQEMI